jgi:hypothetical protein
MAEEYKNPSGHLITENIAEWLSVKNTRVPYEWLYGNDPDSIRREWPREDDNGHYVEIWGFTLFAYPRVTRKHLSDWLAAR